MAKTKALISFAVIAKLICVFAFAYAKSRFSHDEAHRRTTQAEGGGKCCENWRKRNKFSLLNI